MSEEKSSFYFLGYYLCTLLTPSPNSCSGNHVKAYENGRCLFLHYEKKFKILFSIGEELVNATSTATSTIPNFIPTLKVWKSDLTLVRSTKISNGSKIYPVTCFACLGITQVLARSQQDVNSHSSTRFLGRCWPREWSCHFASRRFYSGSYDCC